MHAYLRGQPWDESQLGTLACFLVYHSVPAPRHLPPLGLEGNCPSPREALPVTRLICLLSVFVHVWMLLLELLFWKKKLSELDTCVNLYLHSEKGGFFPTEPKMLTLFFSLDCY